MSTASPTIEDVFLAALDRQPASRAAFVEEACGPSTAMRRRVEALLEAHESAGSFLETPLVGLDTDGEDAESRSPWPDPPSDQSGYVEWTRVARGGTGVVFRARDPKLDRPVAVKMLAREFASRPEARQRFLREARAAAAVRDENVVTIHAIVDEAEPPYLVMEWVEGRTLQDVLSTGEPIPWLAAARIARRIAQGLAAAHDRGLVHRDVKPGNVLIEEGSERVRIADFGLARPVDDLGLTREGTISGTPRYMSPEQAEGAAVDHRTDLFSLGSVLYVMLTGRPPFAGDSLPALLHAIRHTEAPSIAGLVPDVPHSLQQVVTSLLEKDPNRRPTTAGEVATRLVTIVEQEGPTSDAHDRLRTGHWMQIAVSVIVVGIVVLVAIGPRAWNTGPAVPEDHAPGSRRHDAGGEAGPDVGEDARELVAAESSNAGVSPVLSEHDPEFGIDSTAEEPEPPEIETPGDFVEIRQFTAPGRLAGLAVSSDRVFVVGEKGVVHGWKLQTGEAAFSLRHEANVAAIAISRDGRLLATADHTRHVRLWDGTNGEAIGAIPLAVPARGLVFSPNGDEIVVSITSRPARGEEPRGRVVPFDRKLTVFDTRTLRPQRTLPLDDGRRFSEVSWSSDGRWIAATTMSGSVLLMDAASGKVRFEQTASGVAGPAYGLRFSDDSKRLYVAGAGNLLWCWTVPGGVKESFHVFSQSIVRFDIGPHERWAVASGALEVRFADLESNDGPIEVELLDGHESPVRDVRFLPGRSEFVSSGWDGIVRLWGPRNEP